MTRLIGGMVRAAMSRRVVAALIATPLLIAALATGVVTAQEDPGSIGIRLVDAPEDRRDDPRAQIYIVDHLSQGTTITRRVEVQNTTPNDAEVQLYVAAADVNDGVFEFGEGRAENELTDWTTVDPASVVVPAGGGATQAEVTIAVPDDAEDGERYGVIWAELPGSGGAANVVNRVGVRIYLSVGEGEEPVTDFTIDTLRALRTEDGIPVVETTVTNTGGRALDLGGELELANGPGSLTAGPFQVEVGTTLGPGESAPARVELDPELPSGPWDATVTIRSGREERVAEATITFPEEAGEAAEPVDASDVEGQRKILLPIAALAVLLVGAALLFFFLRRRRSDREEQQEG